MIAEQTPVKNRRPFTLPLWLVVILAIALSLIRSLGYLRAPFDPSDEAEFAIKAWAWEQGSAPGVDVYLYTKPPGIVLLYRLLFTLFGTNEIAIKIGVIAGGIAMALLLLVIYRQLFGERYQWTIAILFPYVWARTNTAFPQLTPEFAQNLFVLGAIALLLSNRNRELLWKHLFAGVLLGLGFTMRHHAAGYLLLFVIAYLFLFRSENNKSSLLKAFGMWLIGFLIPTAIFGVYYASIGQLNVLLQAIVYPVVYGSKVSASEALNAPMQLLKFWLAAPAALLFGMLYFGFEQREQRQRMWVLIAWLILAALLLTVGFRFLLPYFGQLLPITALLAAAGLTVVLDRMKDMPRTQLAASVAIALIVVGFAVRASYPKMLLRTLQGKAIERGNPPNQYELIQMNSEEIARWIQQNSEPNSTLFVWGYRPYLYWKAKRMPAAHDILVERVTGWTAGGAGNPKVVADPAEIAMLVQDLKKRQPPFIVDTSVNPIDSWGRWFKIKDYPAINDFIQTYYKPLPELVAGHRIYQLKR